MAYSDKKNANIQTNIQVASQLLRRKYKMMICPRAKLTNNSTEKPTHPIRTPYDDDECDMIKVYK